jgi:monofunctional glycosyltransferase
MKRLILIAILLLAVFAGWQWLTFPDVSQLRDDPPQTTAFMELRKKELRNAGKDAGIEYRWVPYERISPYLRRGVLVAEDNSFFEHEGVDVEGLKEAMRRNWESRSLRGGGSTITQQLAKNLYLSPSRNPWRKVKEYLIARQLEKKLPKKRILEIYLNVVEFGERWYGAEAASRHYFGKSAAGLTAREAALLAGCLPNPRVMNPADPNRRLRARQNMILSRMKRWGHLAEREVLTERKGKEPTAVETSPPPEETPEPTPERMPEERAPEPEEVPTPEAPPAQEESPDDPELPPPTDPAATTF